MGQKGEHGKAVERAGWPDPARQAPEDPSLDLVLHEGQLQILKRLKWWSRSGGMTKFSFSKVLLAARGVCGLEWDNMAAGAQWLCVLRLVRG